MRLSHPFVWVLLAVGAVVVGLALALHRAWRWATWPRVRAQRSGWSQATAEVESFDRLTARGDFAVQLRMPTHAGKDSYREGPTIVRYRGIARLPDAVAERVAAGSALPVRFDPKAPSSLVVDIDALVGHDADVIARTAYFDIGVPSWRRIEAST